MGIRPETFERVRKFAFETIRKNGGRAIPEELLTPAFSVSVVYNVLKALENRGKVARVRVPYKTGANTIKTRKAWRIVGESVDVRGARCDLLKARKVVGERAHDPIRPTIRRVVGFLQDVGATNTEDALTVSAVSRALVGRYKDYIRTALEDAAVAGLVDYVVRPVSSTGKKTLKFYFA